MYKKVQGLTEKAESWVWSISEEYVEAGVHQSVLRPGGLFPKRNPRHIFASFEVSPQYGYMAFGQGFGVPAST